MMLINEIKILHFKSNSPLINCISKINGVQINNAEDNNAEL